MGSRGLIRKILAISGVGKVGEKVSKVPMILIPHSFSIYENLDFCIIKGFESDPEVLAAHPHPEDGFAGMGLPLAAIWLMGKVQSLKFAIQDWVYG